MSEQAIKALQIEYDIDMDRFYIPVNSRYEIQTKGKGSSFRIANTATHIRNLIADEHLHEMLEDMARGTNAELLQAMAATAEANKRINELEGDVAELKEKLKFSEYAAAAESKFSDKLSDQVTELQANNNNLREELSDARHEVFELTISRNYEAAISKAVQLYHKMSTSPATPAESLQAHDDEVIEKCAKVCDEWIGQEPLAEAIRSLKEVK